MKSNMIIGLVAAALAAGCGTVREENAVKISSFGYDPADSTRFIQQALDSGAKKLVLDKQAGPWVTLPLKMRSNTELVIEPGVELVAKRGEYKGLRDYLLELPYATNVTIRGGAGATLRMWKKDYQGPDYKHGEWRYALRIYHCKNVLVEGLNIVESGGDGIGITGEDIVIRNCVCDRNHRQGISLFNAKNLLIENCVLSNTSGTPPQSGIDIEPDTNKERLENVVLRNVVASGNAGCGFELYLNNLDNTCSPIDVRFENCHAIGNSRSASVNGGGSRTTNFVKGRVVFDNCLFEGAVNQAINVSAAVRDGYDVAFNDCVVSNAFPGKTGADVRIGANNLAQGNPDGIAFNNLKIYQPTARNWFACSRGGVGPRSDRVTGYVEVIGPDGKREQVTLDAAWRKAHLPEFNHGRPLPPRATLPAAGQVTAVDARPGELAELQPVTLLYGARTIFFMEKPGKARFTARQVNVVKGRELAKKPLTITYVREDGKKGKTWKIPVPDVKETPFEFDAPKAGFYQLEGPNEGTRFQLMKSSVPVAIDFAKKSQMTARLGVKPFSLWFDAPEGRPWAVLTGGDDYYRFKLNVTDPSGKTIDATDIVDTAHVVNGEATFPAGLYRFDFSRAALEHYDWVNLDVYGAPPYLFLCEAKRWRVKK